MDRLSAIEASIPTMPTVVCRIVVDYAADPVPHRWSDESDRPRRIIGMATDRSAVWSVVTDGRRSRLVHTDTVAASTPWTTFVSSVDLAAGARRWSINESRMTGFSYIAVGVTTTNENTDNYVDGFSTNCTWLFTRLLNCLHAGSQYQHAEVPIDFETFTSTAERIGGVIIDTDGYEFVADASTRQILVRSDQTCFILTTAGTDELFNLLRPVVVLAGNIDLTIHSL